ncbi:unnamed protein product, partial [Prorocentrum cordatum]
IEEDTERRGLPKLQLITVPPRFDFNKLRQQLKETGLFDHSSNSTLAIDGARESTRDTFEAYLRLRMMAKSAVQKAFVEQRTAETNNTKVQILSDVAKLRPLQDFGDLNRVPDRKDQSGWKGTYDLLDINL